jgi:hypothetical protein
LPAAISRLQGVGKKRYVEIMEIKKTGSARPASPTRRAGKTNKSGNARFSDALEQNSGQVSGVSGAGPAQSVDALLSIQEVDDSVDGRSRQGRRWGESVLDKLEALRIGLIGGVIPRADLEAITEMLEEGRGEVNDPELSQILDEIELRARVELAKHGRASAR